MQQRITLQFGAKLQHSRAVVKTFDPFFSVNHYFSPEFIQISSFNLNNESTFSTIGLRKIDAAAPYSAFSKACDTFLRLSMMLMRWGHWASHWPHSMHSLALP